MKIKIKKIIILVCVSPMFFLVANAAKITLEAPKRALANRQPIALRVFLDPENDTLSGIAGNFSFPTNLFTLESISTEGSIVSLWVNQPNLSEEKYLDTRTHITFEGIFPGGYSGVRSPYYKGIKPGVVFSVTLVPKNKGDSSFVLDDILLNSFDKDATPIPTTSIIQSINVPELDNGKGVVDVTERQINNQSLMMLVTRDPLISNNDWYLIVSDKDEKYAITSMYVAETNDYDGNLVESWNWHKAKSPYILFYQNRTKYIHVKVVYSNNTYVIKTLPPVENSKSISYISRILLGVVAVFLLLYFYGRQIFKFSFSFFNKK